MSKSKFNMILIRLNLMFLVFMTVVSCNSRENSHNLNSNDKSNIIHNKFVNLKVFIDVSKSMMKFVRNEKTVYSDLMKKFIPKATARFGSKIELFEFLDEHG